MSEWIDNKNTNIWSHVFEVKSHFWFLLLFTSLQTTLLLTVHSLWFHPRLSLAHRNVLLLVMLGSVIQLWLSQQNMVSVSPPSARVKQTGVFVLYLVCSPPWIGEFFEMHSPLQGGGLCLYPRREKSTETSGPPQGYTKICCSSFSSLTFSGRLWFFTAVDRFLLAVSQLCQDKIIR